MSNRLRTDIEEEEVPEPVEEVAVKDNPENWLSNFFQRLNSTETTELATGALPFVFFLALLAMIYIGNMHLAEKAIRDIDKLSKEVKELSWDYKNAKASLAFKSTLSEVKDRADSLGLKEAKEPPQKITVKEDKQ